MRKPEEILNDSEKFNSMHTYEGMKHFALIAIAIAQKEAYNEAINDAANAALCERTGFGHDHLTGNVSKESILKLLKK